MAGEEMGYFASCLRDIRVAGQNGWQDKGRTLGLWDWDEDKMRCN